MLDMLPVPVLVLSNLELPVCLTSFCPYLPTRTDRGADYECVMGSGNA